MSRRPNVLWIMSDQHNANCAGYRGHPDVRTPNLDRISQMGVDFRNAFANNPICSPSRICFITGQYVHTHGMYGNEHAEISTPNPDTLACLFRRYGYQTGLFGKSHMVRKWDEDGFEVVRYTDLCDADSEDPLTTHYFKYLDDMGLSDLYEEGTPKPGQKGTLDGSLPAKLPYEHSIERFTGNETLKFLENRDAGRPFFIKMSFQRPHSPISPAVEHFNMYDPDNLTLPDNAFDYFENKFESKPSFLRNRIINGSTYPLADPNPDRLKRCLASYYALIAVIDMEIGRVLDHLEKMGELDNTIIFYTADHGDFAGEHGLFHKNFGIYDSIQKIPFLLSWPGSPGGVKCDSIIESIDLYPTLCELCNIPVPQKREGISLIPVVNNEHPGKEAAYCEWSVKEFRVHAVRTKDFRLVHYEDRSEGELYDLRTDPGETNNLWDNGEYYLKRLELTEMLLNFAMKHRVVTDFYTDREYIEQKKYTPVKLVHKKGRYWSRLKNAYEEKVLWPPEWME